MTSPNSESAASADHDVGRQGQVARRDGPDVQVVDALDPGDGEHRLVHLGELDALRASPP